MTETEIDETAATLGDDAETTSQVLELDELEGAKTTPPPPLPPIAPAHITESEFWKLRYLTEHAEKLDAQVALLNEQLVRVVQEQRQTQEELGAYQRSMGEKYGLGPNDRVLSQGVIVRAAPPPATQNGKE
jgi:hypothetical protein